MHPTSRARHARCVRHSPTAGSQRTAPGLRIGGASAALARGRLAHKLFEVLPSVPETDRSRVEQLILASHREVPEGDAATLAAEVREVMAMPALAPVFGMSAMAEVSVAGAVGGAGVAGQIDRLVVDETQVIVADFKTGARPSVTPADYHRQMALYAALLEQIYPDREVVTWLVWTEDRSVEEIDRDTVMWHCGTGAGLTGRCLPPTLWMSAVGRHAHCTKGAPGYGNDQDNRWRFFH